MNKLLDFAIEMHTEALINEHVRTASGGSSTLAACRAFSPTDRAVLAKACKFKSASWFKTVSAMEHIGCEIIGPAVEDCEEGFRGILNGIFGWVENGRL